MSWRSYLESDAKLRAAKLFKDERQQRLFIEGGEKDRHRLLVLIKTLTEGRECPRELCALMSEGEGPDPDVYRTMARSVLRQMDRCLKKLNEELGMK